MSTLTLSLIQTSLFWEDKSRNLAHFDQLINQIEETDLIILPETFSTAFSMNSEKLAESASGPTVEWMKEKAFEKQAVVCGSLIIREAGNIYNRFLWMSPDGTYEKYDKRHLFRMGKEDQYFTPGAERLVVDLKGWKICPMICYDLRFPVWSRNQFKMDDRNGVVPEYDLLIYVANWPEVRVSAWQKLLFARAIENQSFVAAVNRIGEDGLGVNCSGSSTLIDYTGETIWNALSENEEIHTVTIDRIGLEKFRKRFPVGLDVDEFEIRK